MNYAQKCRFIWRWQVNPTAAPHKAGSSAQLPTRCRHPGSSLQRTAMSSWLAMNHSNHSHQWLVQFSSHHCGGLARQQCCTTVKCGEALVRSGARWAGGRTGGWGSVRLPSTLSWLILLFYRVCIQRRASYGPQLGTFQLQQTLYCRSRVHEHARNSVLSNIHDSDMRRAAVLVLIAGIAAVSKVRRCFPAPPAAQRA